MSKPSHAVVALTVAITCASTAHAALFDSMYLFGDSLLDGGNAFVLSHGFPPYPGSSPAPGIPAPYSGRLSNGPTAGEILALNPAILGSPVLPSYVPGGTNYAVAGATTREYVGISGVVAPPPLNVLTPPVMTTSNQIARGYWYYDDSVVDTPANLQINALRPYGIAKQVNDFAAPAGFDAGRSLFVLWGGANDFFVDPATGPAGAANVAAFVSTLYDKGARNFLVPNLPDLSLTPYGQSLGASDQAALSFLSQGFNTALAAGLQSLRATKGGITIIEAHVDDILGGLIGSDAAMAALGFDPTKKFEPCFSIATLSACANPDQHLFWDSVHPTARAYQVLGGYFGDAVLAAVPEPGTYALFALGIVLLAGATRVTRRR